MNRLKEKLLQKSNLWHVGAIVGFIIIATIFFYPAWSGYNVEQDDVVKWVGASQEIKDYRDSEGQPGWTGSMFSGMPADQISMYYPGRDIPFFLRDAYNLWMPRPVSLIFIYMISFYIMCISFRMKPLVAAVMAVAFGLSSSQIIIIAAGHLTKAYAIGYAPLLVAGFMFAYRWKNWILGVGLSALFMTFQLSTNHLQITYYMAFVLLGLGIVELIRYIKKEQIVKFAKITGGLLVAYGIALMVNIGNIRVTSDYTEHTTRGGTELTIDANGESNKDNATTGLPRDYVTAWSYGVGETWTFLVPNYKGGETMRMKDNDANDKIVKGVESEGRNFVKESNQYWGDQPFTSGPVYLGAIVILLALLGLVYSKEKSRWALLGATIITVMLSWGSNFMGLTNFFLDYIPGYNKFRAVTIILCIAQLCVPLLGAMFLQRLIKNRQKIKENLMPMYITAGALGLILLIFMTMPSLVTDFTSEAEQDMLANIDISTPQGEYTYDYYDTQFTYLEEARASILKADALRSFALMSLGFITLFFFIRGVYNKYVMASILGVLLLFDLGGVDKRYLDTEKKGKNYEQWTEAWKQKLPYNAGNGDIQIFNMEAQKNPNLLFALDSAMNVADFEGMDNKQKSRAKDWIQFRVLNRYTNYRVFDYNNPFNSSYASYFHKSIGGYHGAKLGKYQELIEFHIDMQNQKVNPAVLDMLNMKYKIVSTKTPTGWNSQFYGENPGAMGNAWFAKNVTTVQSADEEILALEAFDASVLTIGSDLYPVYINGQRAEGEMLVTGQEQVYFLAPSLLPDGTVVMDTVPQQLPVEQTSAFDLSLIPGQQPGTWNWAYDEMLDTSFTKIMTLRYQRQGWDPREETIMHQDFASNLSQTSYSGQGSITLSTYHPDNLIYKTSSSETQLAVFSEIWYPVGWKAFVDGKETPISRVNYTLRAIEIPAGEHTVEFAYKLDTFHSSGPIAWAGSILVLLLVGAGVFAETRRKDDEEVDEEEEEDEDAPAELQLD